MNKKSFTVSVVAVLLLAFGFAAEAQQQAKVPKIGWLGARPAAPGSGYESFLREFRALGYVEGKNIVIEYRTADNKLDRLPALADELVRLKVDVLLTQSTAEALVAKNATRTIPIVFLGVSDPIAAGLIDSLARPGGNITGFTNIGAVLAGKRLEYSRKPFPSSPALPCCGIHRVELSNNGMKANFRHENWVCSFILWKSAALTN